MKKRYYILAYLIAITMAILMDEIFDSAIITIATMWVSWYFAMYAGRLRTIERSRTTPTQQD